MAATTVSTTTRKLSTILSSFAIILLFGIILSALFPPTAAGRDRPSASSSYHRNLFASRRNTQIPSCSEMASRSQCSQNPACRWCKSDALDDMCFVKTEAWRLPPQVFLCQ